MKRNTVLHPFLFGAFPILFLYAQNAGEMRLSDLVGPLVLTLLVTALLQFVLSRALGDSQRSGVVVSTLLVLFFSFGYLLRLLEADSEQIWTQRNQWIVAMGSLLIFALVLKGLRSLGGRLAPLTSLLNFVGAGLVLVQVLTAAAVVYGRADVGIGGLTHGDARATSVTRPDIFFILLDGYGREDVLANLYAFDNSEFLSGLENKGFHVARDSRAPYIQTLLSMVSIFNLEYLDELEGLDSETDDRVGLSEVIWKSEALRLLQGQGYSTVSFASGYSLTEFKSADRYLLPSRGLSEFSSLVVNTTPIQVILDAGSQAARQRRRIEYVFRTMPELGGEGRPVFILAHIIAPHPPFVLGEDSDGQGEGRWPGLSDGNHRVKTDDDRAGYIERYRQQLERVNEHVKQLVDELLARPEGEEPVIVIASDHGPGSELIWHSMDKSNLRERIGSLFAIYLPGPEALEPLPDSMTPVNTFRLIFNRYFGTEYPLLPTRSFYSSWNAPFQFHEIAEAKLRLTPPPTLD